MAIEPKELMQAPRFEGIGSFVSCRPGNEEWKPSFVFEFLGGQMSVEVEESEAANPPTVGALFAVGGHVRYNNRYGSVSLVSTVKKQLGATVESLSPDQMEQFLRGVRVWGVGIVHARTTSTMNRTTYSKATLKWHGATHEFRMLPPEVYGKIPSVGRYVRFELGISVREERIEGRLTTVTYPSLKSAAFDDLATGSVAAKPAVPPPSKT